MRRLLLIPLALFLTLSGAPTTSRPQDAPRDAGSASPTPAQAEEMRQQRATREAAMRLIRSHAATFQGSDCEGLTLPDDAFLDVELDGIEVTKELAVTFGRARCRDSHSAFTGTGGVFVQFWSVNGGRPALLIELPVHGFFAQAPYLVTMQHGGACPGGAGPSQCRVTYRWDALGRRLETDSRHFMGEAWVLYDYEALTGASACAEGQTQRRGVCR